VKNGLDSATPPTLTQVEFAASKGYSIWSGYLATKPGVRLYSPWSKANFDTVVKGGLQTMAYVSGWDDPLGVRNLADAWGIRLICLDDEGGIRPEGGWVQGFLDKSGAGLYGNAQWHPGRRAAFHIMADYPRSGDPGHETWPTWAPNPGTPCGWQWAGTHDFGGVGVDSTWFDDWFVTAAGGGGGTIGDDFMALIDNPTAAQKQAFADFLAQWANHYQVEGDALQWALGLQIGNPVSASTSKVLTDMMTAIKGISAGSNADVLAAIADLKAHPAIQADPALAAKIDALAKHLGIGSA
jgi:hypothetical protein